MTQFLNTVQYGLSVIFPSLICSMLREEAMNQFAAVCLADEQDIKVQ